MAQETIRPLSGKEKDVVARVAEVFWTKPVLLDSFLTDKEGWQASVAKVTGLEAKDIDAALKLFKGNAFKEMATNNPAGLEPGAELTQGREPLQAYGSSYTKSTVCCPSQTAYECQTHATCGTCMCRPKMKSATSPKMEMKMA